MDEKVNFTKFIKEMLKFKLIDCLIFLYIFFLPFTRIGFKVLQYRFCISDFLLTILLFVFILKKKILIKNINPVYKKFLLLYLIFFIAISISIIKAQNLLFYSVELLAYIYAFIVIYIFSKYISEKEEFGIKIISFAFLFSLIFIIIFSLFLILGLPVNKLVTVSDGVYNRYAYFSVWSNQLVMFMIVAFSVILLKRFNFKKFILFLLYLIFPILFLLTIFFTASRAGLFVSIPLILLFYFNLLKEKKYKKILVVIFLIVLIITIVFIIFFSPKEVKRALSIFSLVYKGKILDAWRAEQFLKAFNILKKSPIFGIGLGNFYRLYDIVEIHSTYLSILTETGIIGFITFGVLFILWGVSVLKNNRKEIVNYLAIFGAIGVYAVSHHILRERWLWIFFIFALSLSLEYKNTKLRLRE